MGNCGRELGGVLGLCARMDNLGFIKGNYALAGVRKVL